MFGGPSLNSAAKAQTMPQQSSVNAQATLMKALTQALLASTAPMASFDAGSGRGPSILSQVGIAMRLRATWAPVCRHQVQ